MKTDQLRAPSSGTRPAPRWARYAFLLTLGFIVVLGPTWMVTKALTHVADTVGGLFKPKVNTTILIGSGITDMRKSLRLIVAEADITAEITKSESYYWWIYFGTTTARVRSTGCHVQYVIPLESFTASDIQAVVTSDGKRTLRVTLPEPQVNEQIVEVNYNNMEVDASSGWARFNKYDVAEEAKTHLRQAAIDEAKKPWHLKAVRADAEIEVRHLLDPLIQSLQPDVKFEVELVPQQ